MEMLKKNEIYTVEIEGYSSEGFGVCRIDGRAVFVPRVLKGERWEIKLVKVTSTSVYARAEKPLVLSPARLEAVCPHFGRCGGCGLLHMSYEEELRFKLDKVNAALEHIGRQSVQATDIIGSDHICHYRNKAIFAVANNGNGPAYGFYRERSHDLISISSCYIQTELSCRIAAALTGFMAERGIPAYDESTGKGLVRHVFCRQAVSGPGAVACIVAAGGFGANTAALVEKLRASCPELTGIVLNVNKNRGNTVLAGDFHTLWGNANISDRLLGLGFEIAPQSFFQINPPQAERLYEKALEYASGGAVDLALDLYCGTGTISLCLTKKFKKILGAEIVPEAIENARKNAERNGIGQAEFICADAGAAAQALAVRGLKPDAIVVDPPRKGMEEDAIAACAAMAPERIVYVSCNPGTLARDILRFNSYGYELSTATAVDMFPRTAHVECVALMRLTGAGQNTGRGRTGTPD